MAPPAIAPTWSPAENGAAGMVVAATVEVAAAEEYVKNTEATA
jgi:hypothetical protein